MRAVLVNFPDSMVEERRRLGIDSSDELWDGEWHFVNPPKSWHWLLNSDIFAVLLVRARSVGLVGTMAEGGLFGDPERNWRVPDQVWAKREHLIPEGLRSAEFLIEVISPGDESYEKLPFYADRGVTEVLILNRDRTFELRRLGLDKAYEIVADGVSEVLGVTFSTVEGPKLRIEWEGGSADV